MKRVLLTVYLKDKEWHIELKVITLWLLIWESLSNDLSKFISKLCNAGQCSRRVSALELCRRKIVLIFPLLRTLNFKYWWRRKQYLVQYYSSVLVMILMEDKALKALSWKRLTIKSCFEFKGDQSVCNNAIWAQSHA